MSWHVCRARLRIKLGLIFQIELLARWRSLSSKSHPGEPDKHLLDILRQGLAKDFPNPERIACPNPALLKGVAQGKISLMEAEPWLDHLSSCSPCFREFRKFRTQVGSQRHRVQIWVAATAVLVFAAAGWIWVRNRPSVQTATTVVLDLSQRSVARGQTPADTGQPSLEIPHAAKHLIVALPIGSKEGNYDLALLTETGVELLRTTRIAQLENHVVILRADIDLAGVRPDSYFLGIRQPGLEWTRFPVRVF